jgi:hypothetical protein
VCADFAKQVDRTVPQLQQALRNRDVDALADVYELRSSLGLQGLGELRLLGAPPKEDDATWEAFLEAMDQREGMIAKMGPALRAHDTRYYKTLYRAASNAAEDTEQASRAFDKNLCPSATRPSSDAVSDPATADAQR